jgi:hypothetical protein
MSRLEEALNRLQKELLLESQEPSPGIWYILWLKPNWELFTYKETEFPNVDHSRVWTAALHIKVAEHYKIDERKVKNLVYAFPRGRVVYRNKRGRPIDINTDKTGKWYLYHGRDFPGGISKWKKKIISEFNIAGFLDKIEWDYDDHERMQRDDVLKMSSLIGKYLK